MNMPRRKHHHLSYFVSSLTIVIGLVLIWRGLWYALDEIDKLFFGGGHFITAIGGVIGGLLVLYLPDKNLNELRKL